ncbi:MAG: YggL family protein [Aliivibrio sp.]|uniref:YggL 50S ribosome-binding family protein n=1 Tax=Aliivibrio sp. TaxID=1872443 RepID=UPI001A3998CA|nr:YggL family protein [Aliivibrio sp.]
MKNNQEKRNRRLRKKLFLAEFAVLGFEINCKIDNAFSEDFDLFLDNFVEFIELRNLVTGAGASETTFSAFVCADGRYDSATAEDVKAVEQWLTAQDFCKEVSVGELVDANYS